MITAHIVSVIGDTNHVDVVAAIDGRMPKEYAQGM